MHHESHILHRQLRGRYPLAVSAQGCFITDASGKRYLDASGGAAVSCLGHGHPDVLQAMHAQIERIAYAHTSFFSTEVAEQLADALIAEAPAGMSHVYLVSGGSEAMEAALKLARQYFVETGQPQRAKFIARRNSYHGNTLGALAVGGNVWRRRQFAPLLIDVEHVSPTYAYRDQRDGESPAQYGERLARELEETIARVGGENVIAFVAETVGGATSGCLTPPPGYFQRVREICDRHGILLILDEVMCGMGRTGTLHACEQEGVAPDLMAVAKGLGGGFQPVGAVLVGGRVIDALAQGSGFFQHGHTYIGHPVACAAALAVQRVLKRDRLVERCARQGEKLRDRLDDAFGEHEHVGDIRGRGLFRAIELVRDRATKEPFDPELKLAARIKHEAMELGLMCYPMGGTIDGARGDHVLLAPPFIVTDEELDLLIERLVEAVDTAVAGAVG
ncbi:MAG: aspartate aminotransferase family protein [Betaproteobacteria bacterium]|nr:MAG: aspartate aminotransferase family protein [Betaproteobacteria bacterium]